MEEDSVINTLIIYATVISSWILRLKNKFLLGMKQETEVFVKHSCGMSADFLQLKGISRGDFRGQEGMD